MFLGMSLLILMTMIAFIINVGLFVKAKINLQNAVDSAAWTGAAVQAKQLTNIAYLNWEIRNVYKEWMFKYYVLGQLSLNKTRLTPGYGTSPLQSAGDYMSFRLDPMFDIGHKGYNADSYDRYNLPSICIHFGKSGNEFNICEVYDVPGLPRFDAIEIPGISEHQEVFLDSIVETKSKNCSYRSELNFSVAMVWAFGTGKLIFHGAPEIASNRPGAWPKAFELAIRMRNLEMFVNRPAIDGGICREANCQEKVDNLDNQYVELPINERPIKAFWSAYRNLNKEMQPNFILHEIPPTPYFASENTLSSYLIPSDATVAGKSVLEKQYLDLQIMPINLVTFFTSFVTTMSSYDEIKTEAACSGSRTGLPVPGYIMGFVKNPDVLTYYAVKGETKFIGLFYPFKDREGITIKAYAAAKPFGGRIGPRIFNIQNKTQIISRKNTRQYRSLPYVVGLQVPGGMTFKPGLPIPLTKTGGGKFWVGSDSDVLGGVPDSGHDVVFAVPNLLYDFEDNSSELGPEQTKWSNPRTGNQDTIQIATPATDFNDRNNIFEAAGLFNKDQFRYFSSNLQPPGSTTTIDSNTINDAILKSRRPTRYEAMNYLIPTCYKNDVQAVDSVPVIAGSCEDDVATKYTLFAPFYGNEALHKTVSDILGSVGDFTNKNDHAITTFIDALKDVSLQVENLPTKDPAGNIAAARSIWDSSLDCTLSIAGKFNQFLRGTSERCGIVPLGLAMEQYWSELGNADNDQNFSKYYTPDYVPPLNKHSPPSGSLNVEMHTGYIPGPRQGASADGEIGQSNQLTRNKKEVYGRRNYYSTKLISMRSLLKNSDQPYPSYGKKAFYQEDVNIGNALTDVYLSLEPDFYNAISGGDLVEFGELTH